MNIGPLMSAGLDLLRWSVGLYFTAAPWILGLGLLAAIGRGIQVGPGRGWSRPSRTAFEIAVESVRLLILVVVIGRGDLLAGAGKIRTFFSGGTADALGRIGQGLSRHWPEALGALILFALVGVGANLVTFTLAALPPVGRAAAAALPDADRARRKLAAVLFIKNLTIIPFTMIWLWGLLLFLAR